MSQTLEISVKGKETRVSALPIHGVTVVSVGRVLKIGRIFDEFWLERETLPSPAAVISELRKSPDRPDLFTFAQRVPDVDVHHAYYTECDNYAVLSLSSFEHWFDKQIPSSTRRNIRASEKRGITVKVAPFDEDYVRGIMSIYDETPVRAGRKFWHFGKNFETVRTENGTYADRSTFLAAYCNDEMVGYLKVVWDRDSAAIMQILSKLSFRDARPNNALLAETVRHCANRRIKYLVYEKFDYGRKTDDSLTKFKENNGFARMDIPRYFVPLTTKGEIALRMGLHRKFSERLPEWLLAPVRELRATWYQRDMRP